MGRILLLREDSNVDTPGTMHLAETSADSRTSWRRGGGKMFNSKLSHFEAMPTDTFTQADINASRVWYEHTHFPSQAGKARQSLAKAASGSGHYLVDVVNLTVSTEFAPAVEVVSCKIEHIFFQLVFSAFLKATNSLLV